MKSQSFVHIAFLLLLGLFLICFQTNAQWIAVSYYKLIKEASDIVIIKVVRIEGEQYGEKAISHVERSFKGRIQSDSIELPFIYTSRLTEKNIIQSVTETMPISFEVGKRYVAFPVKWHRWNFNPHGAETEYEVLNYPKNTFFEFTDNKDPRILEVEDLLKITYESDSNAKVDSLLLLIQSKGKETRIDAIEALVDLKAERSAEAFISVLRNDPDSTVRYSATLGLGFIHSDSIVITLMDCLQKEKVGLVRNQIIRSLEMQRAKKAIPMLLGLYESEGYDDRSAILTTVSALGDSTVVPSLLHFFSIDQDLQHRHMMAQTISFFHTPEADEFSTTLLDTTQRYWLKTAVMAGWSESGYTKGFNQIAKWTFVPCAPGEHPSKAMAEMQGLMYPLLNAIGKLGTPEQIASTVKVYANCNDPFIRQQAVRILKEQMAKDISTKLRNEIEEEIKTFPSQ
jgi:hypothetical protein